MNSLIAFLIALMVSAPDYRPDPAQGLIVVGDSRTNDVRDAVRDVTPDNVFYVAEDGQGFEWFVNMAQGRINQIMEEEQEITDWTILIGLGVNDLMNVDLYKEEYVRLNREEWSGCRLYVTAVGPVVDEICLSASNVLIDAFNYQMSSIQEEGVPFINNTYYIEDVMNAPDGLHYDDETSRKIYRSWLQNILLRERKINMRKEG